MNDQSIKLIREMHVAAFGGRSLSEVARYIDDNYSDMAIVKRRAAAMEKTGKVQMEPPAPVSQKG